MMPILHVKIMDILLIMSMIVIVNFHVRMITKWLQKSCIFTIGLYFVRHNEIKNSQVCLSFYYLLILVGYRQRRWVLVMIGNWTHDLPPPNWPPGTTPGLTNRYSYCLKFKCLENICLRGCSHYLEGDTCHYQPFINKYWGNAPPPPSPLGFTAYG